MDPVAPDLTILDVGHGNCAVIHDAGKVVVIDAGPGTALLEFMTERGLSHVAEVLISHADTDHLKGLLSLLDQENFRVDRVRFNSDAAKDTAQWKALVYALDERSRLGGCDFQIQITEGTSIAFGSACRIDVLAPRPALAATGPGSRDDQGRRITTNTISAVVRVTIHERTVLLTGDIDSVGLSHLLASGQNLESDLLVFPHHGGNVGPGATIEQNAETARRLLEAVDPVNVVFSISRSGYRNPRPEIVGAVRSDQHRHVMCTQMSQNCSARTEFTDLHLSDAFAAGRRHGHCCAGSIVVSADGLVPSVAAHADFVRSAAPTALCEPSITRDATAEEQR